MTVEHLLATLKTRVCEANFYRFCQLVEEAAPGQPLLGSTLRPADDPVRFRPDAGMGFPAGELRAIEVDRDATQRPPTVRTRFMGLYGVDSPLPTAYLDDIVQHREGHEALQGFLDIFNHRLYTQFYRIWRKYSYPASFEPGGTDATSQCLLGLIGLGIPGTDEKIGTPISRFLALLAVMRLPTRNAEGIGALVKLLAPTTEAHVSAHSLRRICLARPASLCRGSPTRLNAGTPLGRFGWEVNSELLLTLCCADPTQVEHWLPDGQLHRDLQRLLKVYLGWRYSVKLALRLLAGGLPEPVLGRQPLRLNMTAVMAGAGIDRYLTIALGRYQGLPIRSMRGASLHVERIL